MPHVLRGLAANPALPTALVDRLVAVADPDIAEGLADRDDLSGAQAAGLASRVPEIAVRLAYGGVLSAADVDPVAQPDAALALLDEGRGDPEWARLFAVDQDPEIRTRLAACPALPPDVVERLADDDDVQVVVELASWTTAAEPAARLAEHPHAEVRRAVAGNEATPPDVLARLLTGEGMPPAERCLVCDVEETPFAHDPQCPKPDCVLRPGASCAGSHESTLLETAERGLWNPATPVATVLRFADHPSPLLRCPVAARTDLPPELWRQLAGDPCPAVRAHLAANEGIDDAAFRALAADTGHDVRRTLAHNARVPLDVLTTLAGAVRIGPTLLPRIAAASAEEIEELARSSHPAARMLVGERRDLPEEIRDRLAADPDAKVVKSVAPHPGLTEALLRVMVERHGSRVVVKVASNPDAPAALLEDVTRHVPPVAKVFRVVARHPRATAPALLACLGDRQARALAARHPNLPGAVIRELLTDADEQVAQAAAANPSLPADVMRRLVAEAERRAPVAGSAGGDDAPGGR
ncbi:MULTISPECIES: hypothetical protein [unclassified Streptomyces]|uniref:hypothetical protein n=1 Tax=unclassified Streptomyces TaxID=2593676 RepID=UPI0036F68DB2